MRSTSYGRFLPSQKLDCDGLLALEINEKMGEDKEKVYQKGKKCIKKEKRVYFLGQSSLAKVQIKIYCRWRPIGDLRKKQWSVWYFKYEKWSQLKILQNLNFITGG